MLTTTRRAISYPNPDRSDRADIALHIGNIALAADSDVIFNQGTDAARLAAAHQNGGGRFWFATDTTLLWYDDGTNWKSVAPTSNLIGTLSARPAANSLTAGSTFFATDQIVDYVSDGAAWFRKGNPAGATIDWFKPDAALPTGWVLYDGTNLPAATGIYADLYAHLGNTLTKPDTRGRFTVALGTNGDVSAIGVNDGLGVGSRSPKHNMTNGLSLPNHAHSDNITFADAGHAHNARSTNSNILTHDDANQPGTSGGYEHTERQIAVTVDGAFANIYRGGGGVGNPTSLPGISGSIGPGGSRPTDGGAYIVCAKIAKL